jgi:hypothetical protein
MSIGMYVTGSFHDQFEIIFGLEQLIKDDVWRNLRWSVDSNKCERMLYWHILKCYEDWKWYDTKISRRIWGTIWIRTDDRGWCHDQILGDIWIGTDDKGWCHDKILCAMWIGKDVKGSFHEKFYVIYFCDRCERMLSWSSTRAMWIGTDVE